MANQQLIQRLAGLEEEIVPTLFKPVQFDIIRKVSLGRKLSENEKRYLRGRLRDKLIALEQIESKEGPDEKRVFLNGIGSYYITGLDALKHNGFGWYFEPKIIEVINTRIEGTIRISKETFKLIRVKSIRKSKFVVDKKTGLKYASNGQVFNDARLTRNEYVKSVWVQMLSRYGKMFAKNYGKLNHLIPKGKIVDYSKFGV